MGGKNNQSTLASMHGSTMEELRLEGVELVLSLSGTIGQKEA